MITETGIKNIWKDVFSSDNNITLSLGYYTPGLGEKSFTELSKASIEAQLGSGYTTPSTAPANRNYSHLKVYFVSEEEAVAAVNKTDSVYLKLKTVQSDEEDGGVTVDYNTVINCNTFVFPEIDDGSPDNINNTEESVDYGAWGTVNGIALYTGDGMGGRTLIYATQLTDPIITTHAMQLRFPAEQLSFTFAFDDE